MSYLIIGDSCMDLPKDLENDSTFVRVPLTLDIDSYHIADDDTFNQADFLAKMSASPSCPKSSCPAPETYMQHFDSADEIYIITLSANLSGSYNSALLAKNLYLEEHPHKKIYVCNSCSASIGETLIGLKIHEIASSFPSFEAVISQIEQFRDKLTTHFVLESLDNLRKNGRLSHVKALIATALNIKPIMAGTSEGTITQCGQARGMKRAIISMAQTIAKEITDPESRTLGIAHCNALERAEFTRDELLKLLPFKNVVIVETRGISTLYANDGGIIVSC